MSSSGMESPLASGSPLDARQQNLLVRYAQQQLSEDETEDVEHLLSQSTQARKFLDRYTRKLPYVDNTNYAPAEVVPKTAAVSRSSPKSSSGNSPSWVPWAALAAVGVSVAAVFGAHFTSAPSPQGKPAEAKTSSTFNAQSWVPPDVAAKLASVPTLGAAQENSDAGRIASDGGNTVNQSSPGMAVPSPKENLLRNDKAMVAPSTNLPSLGNLRSTINFSQTGLTKFRPVLGVRQEVGQPVSLGFVVPELVLPLAEEPSALSSQPTTNGLPVVSAPGLVAVDYGTLSLSGAPFRVITQLIASPWNPGYQLLLVGVQSVGLAKVQRVPANLAFLIDVSDSMAEESRLPLLRNALIKFADQLSEEDRMGIVEYSGAAMKLLPSTAGTDRAKIYSAIYSLQTYGGEVKSPGLQTAYDVVQAHYLPEAANRVVLMTDGDLNVGLSVQQGLMEYIDREAQAGIGFSLIGVGPDILSEPQWKTMTQMGQGIYSQVSSVEGARQALMMQARKPVISSARDVRVEVSVAADQVKSYRLIGYENQWPQHPVQPLLAGSDFHILSVYEIEPVDGALSQHPLHVKSYFHTNASPDPQVLSVDISAVLPNDEGVLAKLRQIIAQVGDASLKVAQQTADSAPKDKPTLEVPTVVENIPQDDTGKVQPQDYQMLQQQAKSWMQPGNVDSPSPK